MCTSLARAHAVHLSQIRGRGLPHWTRVRLLTATTISSVVCAAHILPTLLVFLDFTAKEERGPSHYSGNYLIGFEHCGAHFFDRRGTFCPSHYSRTQVMTS